MKISINVICMCLKMSAANWIRTVKNTHNTQMLSFAFKGTFYDQPQILVSRSETGHDDKWNPNATVSTDPIQFAAYKLCL